MSGCNDFVLKAAGPLWILPFPGPAVGLDEVKGKGVLRRCRSFEESGSRRDRRREWPALAEGSLMKVERRILPEMKVPMAGLPKRLIGRSPNRAKGSPRWRSLNLRLYLLPFAKPFRLNWDAGTS